MILALVFFAVVMLVLVPLLAIACVNTLFGTSIDYTFINWLCTTVLMMIMNASFSGNKS